MIEEILWFENKDVHNIFTPVKANKFEELLTKTNFDAKKTSFLVNGFKYGFPLNYKGPKRVAITAPNLKLHVGSKTEMWNKVMKEIQAGRFAGPFEKIPYKYYIQSPIGLVPKDHGTKTRLIFHLSYPKTGRSVNSCIPDHLCKVKYPEFDKAIQMCINESDGNHRVYVGKSDMVMAFRHVPIRVSEWRYLILMAEHPKTGQKYYMIDKCLPFGSSISCAHFQLVSDGIAHIVMVMTNKVNVNYLDDFLFAAMLKQWCDWQLEKFLEVCETIGFPISMDKTHFGTTLLTSLGLLIDTINKLVCVPKEKVTRANDMIDHFLAHKKVTVHQVQKLCGFLNFLCRAVVPGRAFTTRLYALLRAKNKLKPHHHVRVKQENKDDLRVWKHFLDSPAVFCRPFMDYNEAEATEIFMYSDASGVIGFGALCQQDWMFSVWDRNFLRICDPSIQYLELFALTAGVLTWIRRFKNQRIRLFCDNDSVCKMLNKSSSRCKNCMVLLRLITLESMVQNVRVFAKHVNTKDNGLSDSLSRMDFKRFWELSDKLENKMNPNPTPIPAEIWPPTKVWMN